MLKRSREFVVYAAFAAAACGGESPSAPSSSVPPIGAPTGLTMRTDWGFDQIVPVGNDVPIVGSGGWKIVHELKPDAAHGWAERVTDPNAARSPMSVYDFIYPAGMVEGHAPATVYYDGLRASELHAEFWWRPSSPFDTGPNGNKIAFMFNGGGESAGQQFLIFHTDRNLHVLPEYPGDYRWRTPNINATTVTLGQWHRIDWYSNRITGVLQWWLDGVLQGSYTNVKHSYPFEMFQFSPTWGGNSGARKRQTDHYWFDHVRLSTR